MTQLKNKHQAIVNTILAKYPYKFYAYGSRVKGNARNLSDLDLCYYEDIPDSTIFLIETEFKESDLPFMVELVAWKDMKPSFRELIGRDLTLLN